jgi:predicted Zn finger-like uncharacterized protein
MRPMIIACSACGTKYVVPDDALGVEGRTVRCAKCKHSWFQDGPALDFPARDEPAKAEEPARAEAPPPQAAPAPAPGAPATVIPVSMRAPDRLPQEREQPQQADDEPAQQPVRRRRPVAQPAAAPAPVAAQTPLPDAALKPPPFYRASDHPPAASGKTKSQASASGEQNDAGYSSFDYQPPFRPRRNRLRLLTLAAAGFAAMALMAIAAIQFWGLPSWLPFGQPLFAGEEPGLAMSFPDERQQTRALPTGGEFLAVSGTITNTGRETRSVPPVLIVLRDEGNRVVYSQEIAPPKRNLAPGEMAEVNEAIADIPQSATIAEFGWAPQ